MRAPPSSAPPSRLETAADVMDFAIRIAFFACGPALLVALSAIMPLTGAIVNVGLMLAVFFAAEIVRRWMTRSVVLAALFRRMLGFEEYYRGRPMRPFLYYVFYPLLFPYWLWNREARKELLLFKGYTLLSAVILLGSAVVSYFRRWRPELGLRDYLPVLGATLLVEAIAVTMLIMPLTTTVVTYHLHHRRRRLFTLLAVGVVSVFGGVYWLEDRRDPIVSFETRLRLEKRTLAHPDQARRDQLDALKKAWGLVKVNPSWVAADGKVTGTPLELLRASLDEGLYKTDESYAFDLWAFPHENPRGMVLYYKRALAREVVWVAMDDKGHSVRAGDELSPDLLNKIRALYGK
jgi:hypothetical protein